MIQTSNTIPQHNNLNFRIGLLIVLAMLYVTIDLTSNVFVYRLVTVGSFALPGGIFIYPITFLFADIIAELYGYRIAQLIVYVDIACTFIFALVSMWIMNMSAPSYWHHQIEYQTVLGGLLRINISVLTGLLIGVTLNIYIISKWRTMVQGRYFWLRSVGSSAIGEGVMLLISGIMVFYGTMPWPDLVKLLLVDYAIRLLYAAAGGIPANLFISLIRKHKHFQLKDDTYLSV